MTEADYIKVQALTQLRITRDVLREIIAESAGIDGGSLMTAREIVGHLIETLEMSVGDLEESDA